MEFISTGMLFLLCTQIIECKEMTISTNTVDVDQTKEANFAAKHGQRLIMLLVLTALLAGAAGLRLAVALSVSL